MIRQIVKQIRSCNDCPHFLSSETLDNDIYNCKCDITKNKFEGVYDNGGDLINLDKTLNMWLECCPKWNKVLEVDVWYPNLAGICPVSHDTLVDTKFRDGSQLDNEFASRWSWLITDESDNIIEFRIRSKEKN